MADDDKTFTQADVDKLMADIVFRTLLKSVFAILNRRVWLCV